MRALDLVCAASEIEPITVRVRDASMIDQELVSQAKFMPCNHLSFEKMIKMMNPSCHDGFTLYNSAYSERDELVMELLRGGSNGWLVGPDSKRINSSRFNIWCVGSPVSPIR